MNDYISFILREKNFNSLSFDALPREYYTENELVFKDIIDQGKVSIKSIAASDAKGTYAMYQKGAIVGDIQWSFVSNEKRTKWNLEFPPKGMYFEYVSIRTFAQGSKAKIKTGNQPEISFVTLLVSEFLRVTLLNTNIDYAFLYIESMKPEAAFNAYLNAALYLNLIVEQRIQNDKRFFIYTRGSSPTLDIPATKRTAEGLAKKPMIRNRELKRKHLLIVDIPQSFPRTSQVWRVNDIRIIDKSVSLITATLTVTPKESKLEITSDSTIIKNYSDNDLSLASGLIIEHVIKTSNQIMEQQKNQIMKINVTFDIGPKSVIMNEITKNFEIGLLSPLKKYWNCKLNPQSFHQFHPRPMNQFLN
jgi:hypothetical protein